MAVRQFIITVDDDDDIHSLEDIVLEIKKALAKSPDYEMYVTKVEPYNEQTA